MRLLEEDARFRAAVMEGKSYADPGEFIVLLQRVSQSRWGDADHGYAEAAAVALSEKLAARECRLERCFPFGRKFLLPDGPETLANRARA